MDSAIGGLFWIIPVLGGAIVLGIALAYASRQWWRRDRRLDPLREQATEQRYAEEQERLEDKGEAEPLSEEPRPVPDRPMPAANRRRRAADPPRRREGVRAP